MRIFILDYDIILFALIFIVKCGKHICLRYRSWMEQKESCHVRRRKKKESQSYATLMLLIRVPTIIRSDGSFVHLCPQKGKENRVTVATFILSYKEMMVNL